MQSFIFFLIIISSFKNQQWVKANLGWSKWSQWECTATCGGGAGRKTRTCVSPGPNRCSGGRYKFGKCNEQPCPVVPKPLSNKGWTPWMPWECPVTCGGGTGVRSRICEDPDVCEGPEEESGPCGEEPCPVDRDEVNEDLQRQIEQQMKTSKHNFVVQQGESVAIPCKDRVASILDRENSDAKVSWIHNGEMVDIDGKRIKMENGGDLRVKADVKDNGLWWCSVALTSKTSVTLSFAAVGVQNKLPDVVVEKGESFQMACRAKSLGRLVKSKLDQRWIHNSTTFKELVDVRPERREILKIPASNYSNSGIWNCRYTERGGREWVTSVLRVQVIPPRTLLQRLWPLVLFIVLSLVVIAAVAWIYWNRVKKLKVSGFDDEEDEEEEEETDDDFEDEDEPKPLFADQLEGYKKRRDTLESELL